MQSATAALGRPRPGRLERRGHPAESLHLCKTAYPTRRAVHDARSWFGPDPGPTSLVIDVDEGR